MFEISFEVNGRKVSPNKVGDALQGAILKEVQDSIKKKVGAIRCPKHGRGAKIVAQGRELSKLSIEVSGCCDALVEPAQGPEIPVREPTSFSLVLSF